MNPYLLLACVLAAACLSGCNLHNALFGFPEPVISAAATLPVELPFREGPGGLVVITGRVDGKQDVEFILDTGAPVTVLLDGPRTANLGLDTRAARKLGPADDPAVPTGVISPGHAIAFGPVRLDALTAVLIPVSSLPCAERFESIGFGGVIGANLFRRFVVEIDWKSHKVRLHEPGQWAGANARAIALTFVDGHPFVDASVRLADGRDAEARLHLDTGMNKALALTAGAHAAFTMPAQGKGRGDCFVSGTRLTMEGAPVTLAINEVTIPDVIPSYSESAPRFSGRSAGSVGVALLRPYRIAIDYPGKRLLILE